MPWAGPSLMRFCKTAAGLGAPESPEEKLNSSSCRSFLKFCNPWISTKDFRRPTIHRRALFNSSSQSGHDFGQIAVAGMDDFVREGLDDRVPEIRARKIRAASLSSTTKAPRLSDIAPPAKRARRPESSMTRSSLWPTINRLLPLCRWKTASVGPLMELGAPSQTRACAGAGLAGGVCSSARKSRFSRTSAGALPSNTNGPGNFVVVGALADFGEITVAHFFRQPDGLKRAVAFNRARPRRCKCLRRGAKAVAARDCPGP